jgi:hypothetical protein
MANKIAKYTLPKSEEALDTLANSVLTYATPHIEGAARTGRTSPPRVGRPTKPPDKDSGRCLHKLTKCFCCKERRQCFFGQG